jgi:RNA polymerase sigma-32 factor
MQATTVMDAYQDDLRRHAGIVERERELALARRAQAGGRDARAARDALVKANLRLVVKFANEYARRNRHVHIDDLVQEGNIGLLLAVDKFDPERGIKFGTYAAFWIRARMLDIVISSRTVLKIGRTSRVQRRVIFHGHKCKGVTIPEISAELKLREHDVEAVAASLRPPISIHTEGKGHQGRDTPNLQIERALIDGAPLADDMLADKSFVAAVQERLGTLELDERERDLVYRRFMQDEPATLLALGEEWGVTRERVRQVETLLLARLRRCFGDMSDLLTEAV